MPSLKPILIVILLVNFCFGELAIGQEKTKETVKIGLLLANKNDSQSLNAVQLAFDEINSRQSNLQFKLLVRYTDGPWGIASNQVVKFIYEDDVSALISSLDSRTAHLAEQVCAKAHYILMSTWSTDPSLTQAYVPWYFRVVPNDNQQANFIAETILKGNARTKTLLVTDNSNDSELAAKSLLAALKDRNIPAPSTVILDSKQPQLFLLQKQLENPSVKNVVLLVKPALGEQILEDAEHALLTKTIYGNIASLGLISHKNWKENYTTFGVKTNEKRVSDFETRFIKRYNYAPNAKAVFAYDGAMVLTESIRMAGTDAEELKDYLLNNVFKQTLSGEIRFDKLGNRID